MVINTFDLYDIIADIIPGVIGTLALTVFVIPTGKLPKITGVPQGPGALLLIVAVSFVVGRIIRYINPWKVIDYGILSSIVLFAFFNKLSKRTFDTRLNINSDIIDKNTFEPILLISFEDKLRSIFYHQSDQDKLRSIFYHQSDLNIGVVKKCVMILRDKYDYDFENGHMIIPKEDIGYSILRKLYILATNESKGRIIDQKMRMESPPMEFILTAGNSELYNKATLYQRYTIISKFNESISKVFFISAIGSGISAWGIEANDWGLWSTVWTDFVWQTRDIYI
jgi:hypothetical protein